MFDSHQLLVKRSLSKGTNNTLVKKSPIALKKLFAIISYLSLQRKSIKSKHVNQFF